jgi:hypothetical protein
VLAQTPNTETTIVVTANRTPQPVSRIGQSISVVDLPELEREIAAGRFTGLLDWMRRHVHQKGRLLESEPLVEAATRHSSSNRELR